MPPAKEAAEPREFVFTAAKGVRMFGGRVQFEHVQGLDTPFGQKRFRFATPSAEVAELVRGIKVEKYGIAEVTE